MSGPPFSVYTHVLETWIEGQKVFDRSNPQDLRYATGGIWRRRSLSSFATRGKLMRALRWLRLLICVASSTTLLAENFAVLADHLYTMADGTQGGPGMVLIRDGKIEAVRTGPHQQPPDGYTAAESRLRHSRLD